MYTSVLRLLFGLTVVMLTFNESQGCGGTYTRSSGDITSPNYPYEYGIHHSCYYRIQMPVSTEINIMFSAFNTEANYDYLRISCTVGNPIAPLSYTGYTLPSPITIRSCTELTMTFTTDGSGTRSGFSLRYQFYSGCRATYVNSSADIWSLNYPNAYSNDLDCYYVIQIPVLTEIKIVFITFNTEADNDWLQINCTVGDPMTPLQFSGSNLPSPLLISSCTQITMIFHSNNDTTEIGFLLRYQFNPDCGKNYTELSGNISSPNYPRQYGHNLNCYSFITVPQEYSVTIEFIEFGTQLSGDWLQINCATGRTITPLVFKGNDLPPFLSIQSCRQIVLLFHSDSAATGTGFHLQYEFVSNISGGFSLVPMNAFPLNNSTEDITLNCASLSGNYPWWSYSSSGSSPDIITNASCMTSDGVNGSTYRTVAESEIQGCHLLIKSSRISSALGVYTCTDSSVATTSALVANLGITHMVWTGNDPTKTIEVVENDKINITCLLRMSNPLPQIRASLSFASTSEIIPTTDWVANVPRRLTFTVVAKPEIIPSYTCNVNFTSGESFPAGFATNLPGNLSLNSTPIQVLYWPKLENIAITGDVLGKMTFNKLLVCHVPSHPPATYFWTDVELKKTEIGPTIHVTHDGTYTCTATNFIKGITHSVSKSVTVTLEDWSAVGELTITGDVNGKMIQNRVLVCHVLSFPPATYVWTDVGLNETIQGPTIHVTNDGTYTCTATNIIKGIPYSVSKSITVTLEAENLTITGDVDGKMIQNRLLVCHITSFPPATYVWTDVGLNETIRGPTIHLTHEGTYTCTATNIFGGKPYSVSKSITVTFEGTVQTDVDAVHPLRGPIIVAIIVGVTILIVNIIVILCLIWRKKLPCRSRGADGGSRGRANEGKVKYGREHNLIDLISGGNEYSSESMFDAVHADRF